MRRMGLCNRLRPEKAEEYQALHAAAWPDVLACITACNIRNFSIFLRMPENLLFAYWEYHGEDFEADARKMAGPGNVERSEQCLADAKTCAAATGCMSGGVGMGAMGEFLKGLGGALSR